MEVDGLGGFDNLVVYSGGGLGDDVAELGVAVDDVLACLVEAGEVADDLLGAEGEEEDVLSEGGVP